LFEEKLAVVLVVVGFYLADCIVLLRPTQALGSIALSWRSILPWRLKRQDARARPGSMIQLSFGLTFYPTRGYFPALLNPFTPWAAVFKTAPLLPSIVAEMKAGAVPMHRLAGARLLVRTMGALLAGHAGILFVALPYLLFKGQIERLLTFLAVDFVIAASIIALCYPIVRMLRLQRGQFWSLAIQSLLCLPLSLNFPRKLALLAPANADAAGLMPRVPGPDRWRIAQDFIAVLEYAQNARSESDEADRLTDVLASLRKEVPVE
jgi:hypothetical protein